MKLPTPEAWLKASGRGNLKRQAAPGEVCAEVFSDRGSTPLASTIHLHVMCEITKKSRMTRFSLPFGFFVCPERVSDEMMNPQSAAKRNPSSHTLDFHAICIKHQKQLLIIFDNRAKLSFVSADTFFRIDFRLQESQK